MEEIYGFEDAWYGTYDHAATWFMNEVLDRYGRSLMPCQKDLNNKENKLGMIKDMLIDTKLIFSDRCMRGFADNKGLIWEMINYRKDDNGRIPKENDHAIDALRYKLNAMGYDPRWLEKKDAVGVDSRGMALTYDHDKVDYYGTTEEKQIDYQPRDEYEY